MAKKKSRKVAVKSVKQSVAIVFDCPFCNNKKTCEVKLAKKEFKASISCRLCASHFSTKYTSLTEPIDVYSEWIDECEKINK